MTAGKNYSENFVLRTESWEIRIIFGKFYNATGER